MKTVIRLRRSFFRRVVVLLPFFSAMLIISLLGMYLDAPPDRRLVGVLFVALGWSVFVGITVWLLLAYRRYSIVLGDDDVTFKGIWTDLTVRLPDVAQATCQMPAVMLRLNLKKGNKTIGLGEYALDRRREIVRYFRERIDPGLQSGRDDGWEWYPGPEEVTRILREYHATFPRLLLLLILGPFFGLVRGLVLSLSGMEVPRWTGSLAFDWTVRGTLVSLGLAVMLGIFHWMDQPDSSPAEPDML
jgi:hypothetical protein